MRKNITVTVSVRVSATVRVSLVLFVSSNTFGASSVAICRRCVYKIFVAYAQRCLIRCVYNKSVAFYTRLCIRPIGEEINANQANASFRFAANFWCW